MILLVIGVVTIILALLTRLIPEPRTASAATSESLEATSTKLQAAQRHASEPIPALDSGQTQNISEFLLSTKKTTHTAHEIFLGELVSDRHDKVAIAGMNFVSPKSINLHVLVIPTPAKAGLPEDIAHPPIVAAAPKLMH